MSFPPLDYTSFSGFGGGGLGSLGPGTQAFPDLDDYVSLITGQNENGLFQQQQPIESFDALESLLLAPDEANFGGLDAVGSAGNFNYMFGDTDPLFDVPIHDLLQAQQTVQAPLQTINPQQMIAQTQSLPKGPNSSASSTRSSMSPLATADSPPASQIPSIIHPSSSSPATSSTSSTDQRPQISAAPVVAPATNSRKRKLTPEEKEDKAKER